ncbi:MAG: FAD-dependent oxidoreductase, partial [Synergistaceae bacterium]
MEKFDVVIIGFGKGGKTLAADLASEGKKIALIEKSNKMYGGTCPNVGCVPTKFFVTRAEISEVKDFKTFESKARFYAEAVEDKNQMRKKIQDMMSNAMNKNPNITLYTATASFVSKNEIQIKNDENTTTIYGDKVVIDTGSYPFIPPINGLKESANVLTSEGLLDLKTLPKKLVIIGGGNIGLEFASIYAKFGSDVTVLQDLKDFYPNEDEDVAKLIKESMEKSGIKFEFGVKVQSIEDKFKRSTVTYEVNGIEKKIDCDNILVSTGRRPYTEGLNLSAATIEVDARGAIKVDDKLRTTVSGIWAIGDVVGGAQFTYISQDDCRIVKSDMEGGSLSKTGRLIATSTFLSPTLSRVGLTEKAARENGYNIKASVLYPGAIPRCHATGRYTGILKAVVDADTNMILGVSLFCDESHEMINIVKLVMDLKLPYTVLKNHMFTHPVMS